MTSEYSAYLFSSKQDSSSSADYWSHLKCFEI